MTVSTRLRLLYLLHFAKPAADRAVYRVAHEQPIRTMLEVGVGTCQRALRLLELASLRAPAASLRYIGIDPFESRDAAAPASTLKAAHCALRASGAKVQLVPGEPRAALARVANNLPPIDLMIVSDGERAAMAEAWFYVPRILHPRSMVFVETREEGRIVLRTLPLAEVERLASRSRRRAA